MDNRRFITHSLNKSGSTAARDHQRFTLEVHVHQGFPAKDGESVLASGIDSRGWVKLIHYTLEHLAVSTTKFKKLPIFMEGTAFLLGRFGISANFVSELLIVITFLQRTYTAAILENFPLTYWRTSQPLYTRCELANRLNRWSQIITKLDVPSDFRFATKRGPKAKTTIKLPVRK